MQRLPGGPAAGIRCAFSVKTKLVDLGRIDAIETKPLLADCQRVGVISMGGSNHQSSKSQTQEATPLRSARPTLGGMDGWRKADMGSYTGGLYSLIRLDIVLDVGAPGGGGGKKASINLMNLRQLRRQAALMHQAPRCSATSKQTGRACRSPGVRGKSVCHKHGARGGAPSGRRNGMYRHGGRTKHAQAERRYLASLLRGARDLMGRI